MNEELHSGKSEGFELRALELAEQLISCNSYNPPGDESRAAALCARILEEAGYEVETDEFLPNRQNVVATYGPSDDIALILYGHLDVVPAFEDAARLRMDGKFIYGRGSADMLGGCAAAITAACFAAEHMRAKRGVMILLVADEEDKNLGMRHELKKRKFRADAAVIAEPTGLQIHLGNRGYSSFCIRSEGEACHAGMPENGENAIYKMGRIIGELERYAASLGEKEDERLGKASACVCTIRGGVKVNIVPDMCEVEFERRLLPGEDVESVIREIENAVGDNGRVIPRTAVHASLIDKNDPLVKNCADALREVIFEEPAVSVFPACTEAGMFSAICGIPTLILGPGDIKSAHTGHEYCECRQITDCAKVFARLIEKYIE